jgi:hypothetical protein
MSFDCRRHDWFWLALGAVFMSSCASEVLVSDEVGARASSLELECAAAPAGVTADIVSILSSIEPLDPSQPQAYETERCGGFIFEFDNPDEEALRGAWIQAGARSGVLDERECRDRVLDADYWGFKDRAWSKLATSSSSAGFEPDTQDCRLEALIEHAGTFEKLRIVARVSDGSETYPMYACVW